MTSDRLKDAMNELDRYRRQRAPEPLDLFTPVTEPVTRVTDNPRPWWWSAVFDVVDVLAARRPTFTVDDVRDELEERALDLGDVDLRALGAVLRASATAGVIAATDEYAPSRRRNRSPLRVWRSRRWAA